MPAGRPTALTEEVGNRIIAAIQRGAYMETAAQFAGIAPGTLHAWMKKAAKLRDSDLPVIQPENQRLVEFHEAIQRALAESEVRDVNVIDQAAQQGQWQAAAWKLERKHHARWGRKMAITDNQGENFFTGMAAAWAEALETDDDEMNVIEHDPPKKLNGGSNGSEPG